MLIKLKYDKNNFKNLENLRILEEVGIQKYFKLSLFFYIDKNFEK